MEVELFSNSLPEFSGSLENPALLDSLNSISTFFDEAPKLLHWSETQIAIPLQVQVNLPSLGNYCNIDIRSVEPILVVLSTIDYPSTAPMVFANRIDFPNDKLAHLYIATAGRPPAFCYVRGSRDDWYANKRITDLLGRVGNWLQDAASGELTEDGDQFEPLRLEGYSGTIVYDYDTFAAIVNDNKSVFPDKNYAIALFERLSSEETGSYKFKKFVTLDNYLKVFEEVNIEKKKDKDDKSRRQFHYGYLLWSNSGNSFADYKIDLPTDWEQFKLFCKSFEIDIEDFEDTLATGNGNHLLNFPVIVGIRRPKNLIGFSSSIEFVNLRFRLDTDDVKDGKLIANIPIKFQLHNQPLTQAKARQISNDTAMSSPLFRDVIFGCGALGSKLVMHMARSGRTQMTLIDPDEFSPHNLVRHALFAEDEGQNKASALKNKIEKLFPFESTGTLCGPSFKDGYFDNPATFANSEHIFDFTASEAFFNRLVSAKSMDDSRIISANITDLGNLGVMLKEGELRNPRIDDLQALLYSQSFEDTDISEWLSREQEANSNANLIVQVGVGCNSETTVLSDDKISSHASYFYGAIKNESVNGSKGGKIFLNKISEGAEYSVQTRVISVESFDVIPAINDPKWNIRFKSGILQQMNNETKNAGTNETGGVFTGVVNYKTLTIHVTGLVTAPTDSRASSICFFRGSDGLPIMIDKVIQKSGGQLGYVGEWHSHPNGPNELSAVDMKSVYRFKKEFSGLTTPLPVFLTVVAPNGVLPFVF
ncbi:MAG: thiamine biosynthesis protein ThiF [Chryseobacterium sp.]|nr:MAG: thiamine biosynthesis protein ThiF [Chryseobacterium sp.]